MKIVYGAAVISVASTLCGCASYFAQVYVSTPIATDGGASSASARLYRADTGQYLGDSPKTIYLTSRTKGAKVGFPVVAYDPCFATAWTVAIIDKWATSISGASDAWNTNQILLPITPRAC